MGYLQGDSTECQIAIPFLQHWMPCVLCTEIMCSLSPLPNTTLKGWRKMALKSLKNESPQCFSHFVGIISTAMTM